MNHTQEELIQAIKTLAQQNANLSIENALLQAKLESAYRNIDELSQNQEETK